jgi:hypothetical protein
MVASPEGSWSHPQPCGLSRNTLDLSAAPQQNRADQETSELNSKVVEVLVNRLLGPPNDPLPASTRRGAPRALGAGA